MSEAKTAILNRLQRYQLNVSILAGIVLAVGYALSLLATDVTPHAVAEILFFISLALGLIYGSIAAYEAIRDLEPNIDVLMVVGAVLAAALGHPEEGALLLFLFVLSAALEERALRKTTATVRALTAMIPESTLLRVDGKWIEADPEDLKQNDLILIRPGERAPADGRVTLGLSAFNQASLTGESRPRNVEVGDEIFEGTINEENPVEVTITKPAAESSLHRVLHLVTAAQDSRQPVQQLIDRLSKPYAIAVFTLAITVFAVYSLLLDQDWTSAANTAITILVVASPCALVIATPTATLSAISRAAKIGVLFKGGDALTRTASVNAAAFDKTGTLTKGKPTLTAIHPVAWSDEDSLLCLAAGLEQGSTHPIGNAIRTAAEEQNLNACETTDLAFHPGGGVSGKFNGNEIRLGRYALVEPLIPICLRANVRKTMAKIQSEGGMAVVIAHDEQAAVIALQDTPRAGASEMMTQLHKLNIRPIVMLTGDVEEAAKQMAEQVGIDEVRAELLPEKKLAIVDDLKKQYGKILMIGDGVNDAPALATSDAAFAVGSIGSDAAIETADVILTNENLEIIPWAIALARSTKRIIAFNLTFAISAIILLILGTLIGKVSLVIGVIGHEGGTLLVVANSLRLFFHKPPNSQFDEHNILETRPNRLQQSLDDHHHLLPQVESARSTGAPQK